MVVIPRDGGEPQVVDTDGYGPTWSPDGRFLAWVSYGEGGAGGSERLVGIADVVTTASSIVITNRRTVKIPVGAEMVGRPRFSPDGETLLFPAGRHSTGNFEALYTMSTSGGGLRKVSGGRYLDSVHHYSAFSPDGSKILYLGVPDGQGWAEVVVVGVDGSAERVLSGQVRGDAPTWTPGGDMVAMTGGFLDGVCLVDLDGRLVDRFALRQFQSYQGLVMAPDGSRVYSVADPVSTQPTDPDLYAIPLDGSAPQRLTFDHQVFPDTVQAIDPGLVLRQYGDGPAATAAAALTENVEHVDTLVVTPADDVAATLTAAPLAARLGAAALVTARTSVSAEVLVAAERLGASRVVLVGSLSPAVAAGLRAAGLHVSEVARTRSPYRLGAKVASQLTQRRAYLVPMRHGRQRQWKLPLATAGIAALQERPLFFSKPQALSKATKAAMRKRRIISVTVVGDDKAVGPKMLRQLADLGVKIRRIKSSDPYELSARFAGQALKSGARADRPVVASGDSWTSSVTAPALAALMGQVTLLVDNRSLNRSKPTAEWLRSHRRLTRTVALIGGVRVVRPRVEMQLENSV